MLEHGHGMCQDADTGCVRARLQDESRCREQPQGWTGPCHGLSWPGKPALTTATTVLPADWGCGEPGATSGSAETSGTPRKLLPPTLFPTQPPGVSEPGRDCLGVSSEICRMRPQQGQPRQPPAGEGEQPWGTAGFKPQAGLLAGAPALPRGRAGHSCPAPGPCPARPRFHRVCTFSADAEARKHHGCQGGPWARGTEPSSPTALLQQLREGSALIILPGTPGPSHRAELCSWLH